MPKTIIISNRLPVKFIEEENDLKAQPSEGGLATGLSSFYKKKGNDLNFYRNVHTFKNILKSRGITNFSPIVSVKEIQTSKSFINCSIND